MEVDVLLSCPELGSDVGRRQLARPSHIDKIDTTVV